ncbi:hypothetical protein JOH50_006696 [Rhizobium leguminosarum]|nr:hypothetical protein [Rhizobium leguminosarum]
MIDGGIKAVNQAIMQFSREIAAAAGAVCEDGEPETSELGVEHQAVIGCHRISFILPAEIGAMPSVSACHQIGGFDWMQIRPGGTTGGGSGHKWS